MKRAVNQRIAVDLVPIRVGEGGAGSGIWTYARELILHMDIANIQGLEVVCFVNSGQASFFPNLRNIRLIQFPGFGKNILLRLLWVHVLLPILCVWHRIGILHKLTAETPVLCWAKRVTTIHDFYYEFLMETHSPENIRFYERLEKVYFSFVTRICFWRSRSIIAVSEATRREAVSRYPSSADRIQVIHHGAPLQPSIHDPQPSVFNILCVAKFMKHKGQHLLINAFEALLEKTPELTGFVRLTLRGFHNDEDYYRTIKARVSGGRWFDSMKIIPFSPADSLETIYKDADLVVLLSSYEGFGLPVLEAQGEGVPVVCSNLPVLREVGGEGAVYVDREDQNAVVNALHRLISDAGYYAMVRAQALANIQRFSWDEAAQQTLAVYREV